jgi:hypothetical protein
MKGQLHEHFHPLGRTLPPRPCHASNFEAVFHIPSAHYLRVVRSRSRGGLLSGVYWEHEEYDPKDALIARYKSFSESPARWGVSERLAQV